jgi:hypothetical protein
MEQLADVSLLYTGAGGYMRGCDRKFLRNQLDCQYKI